MTKKFSQSRANAFLAALAQTGNQSFDRLRMDGR